MRWVVGIVLSFTALSSAKATAWAGMVHWGCEQLLAHEVVGAEVLEAAVTVIDYGEGGYGEVIVIKDREIKPGESGGREEGPSRRPEIDVPRPEPQLEIITPTPTRKKELPIPAIQPPSSRDISKITPKKKPPKPLPN